MSSNKWMVHVKEYREQHPTKSWKQCLKDAKESYQKPKVAPQPQTTQNIKDINKEVKKAVALSKKKKINDIEKVLKEALKKDLKR